MGSNILYIIGNGFDLHHNLKTKYSDFKEYLQKVNSSLEYLLDMSFSVDLWSDFENHLASLDIKEIFSDNDDLLPDDDSDRDGDKYILPDKLEQIKEDLTTGLKNTLRDWILNLYYPSNLNNFLLFLDKNAGFLTLNYSDTLERFYYIEPEQITYLHNKAKSERHSFKPDEMDYLKDDSDIIIGHALENQKVSVPHYNSRGFKTYYAYEEGLDALKPYFQSSFKNTDQIISDNSCFFDNLSNIKKVIIIGHSLSDVDMPYFKTISKRAINVNAWEITFYGDDNLNNIKQQSAKFLSNDTNINFINLDDDISNINRNLSLSILTEKRNMQK